jgi:CrcB protein
LYRRPDWAALSVVSLGGVIGAESRYGAALALGHSVWSTLLVNASGCLCLGILVAVLDAVTSPHRLYRLFLGVGILGGYTTFSTFSLDTFRLLDSGRPGTAALYLGGALLTAFGGVWAGSVLTSKLIRKPIRRGQNL